MEGAQSRAAGLLHRKEPAEKVWASDQDASWSPPLRVFQTRPTGRKSLDRPRTNWKDYTSILAWEHFGIPQQEVESVAKKKRCLHYMDGHDKVWCGMV